MGQAKHTPVLIYFGAIDTANLVAGELDVTGFGMESMVDEYLAADSPNGVMEFTTVGHKIREASGQCLFSAANWAKLQASYGGADDQDINVVLGKGTDQRKLVMEGKVTTFNLSQAGSDKTGRIDFTLKFNPPTGKTNPQDHVALATMS